MKAGISINFVNKICKVPDYPENPVPVPRFSEANGFYTTSQRSKLMSRIKAKDTKPEIKLRKALWQLGYRYRKNFKDLPGAPDLVFLKQKVVVFVDGEFWHGYNWSGKRNKIKTNRDFWIPKIERNIQRDQVNNRLLSQEEWKVIRIWEHEIKKDFTHCLERIIGLLEPRC